MRIRKYLTQPDVYIAALILIASTISARYVYAKMMEEENKNSFFSLSLQSKESIYEIRGEEGNQGSCFGWLKLWVVEKRGELSFESKGELATLLNQELLPLRLKGDLSFNALGQLGGSIFEVRGNDFSLVIGSTGISPIEMTLRSGRGKDTQRYNFSIPGPLEVTKHSQNYEFKYMPFIGKASSPLYYSLAKGTGNLPVPFRLLKKDFVSEGCYSPKATPLDLNLIRAKVMEKASGFLGGIGGQFLFPSSITAR